MHHQMKEPRSQAMISQVSHSIPLHIVPSSLYKALWDLRTCQKASKKVIPALFHASRADGGKADGRGVDGITLKSLKQLITSHQL
jgi:hypothetical protein